MKTSTRGIALIKEFEGFRPKAYLCPAGIPTIGYGHTKGVKPGDTISERQGEQFLREDLAASERVINALSLPLSQNQFDALVSFVFNVGSGNFTRSTLLKKVRVNTNDPSIAGEFERWNKARVNGVLTVLPGLVRRRKAESDVYFSK
ncbi:lysozyme [Limibacterium fermenti]|uniref:lysozyme n=1 Tax=Limibacterium fermenti TaxID=3229863 RepID=UPI003A62739F